MIKKTSFYQRQIKDRLKLHLNLGDHFMKKDQKDQELLLIKTVLEHHKCRINIHKK